MRIIVKIMRIIVLEHCFRLLSILYVAFPVDAVELAFLIDTNQPFLGEWVKNCCMHITIFWVLTLCHN